VYNLRYCHLIRRQTRQSVFWPSGNRSRLQVPLKDLGHRSVSPVSDRSTLGPELIILQMQHRMHRSTDNHIGTPPKSPFIRPHLSQASGGGFDKKRTALLGSSTARIWAIIIGICFLFAVTRTFGGPSTANTSFYDPASLHPVNYLNTSQSTPPPFPFCPVHGPGDVIGNKYGAHAMAKSRLHLGSSARTQRLIHRV